MQNRTDAPEGDCMPCCTSDSTAKRAARIETSQDIQRAVCRWSDDGTVSADKVWIRSIAKCKQDQGIKHHKLFMSIIQYNNIAVIVNIHFYAVTSKYYKDRKCADNENPYSAHIVSVKLYERIIVLWPFR